MGDTKLQGGSPYQSEPTLSRLSMFRILQLLLVTSILGFRARVNENWLMHKRWAQSLRNYEDGPDETLEDIIIGGVSEEEEKTTYLTTIGPNAIIVDKFRFNLDPVQIREALAKQSSMAVSETKVVSTLKSTNADPSQTRKMLLTPKFVRSLGDAEVVETEDAIIVTKFVNEDEADTLISPTRVQTDSGVVTEGAIFRIIDVLLHPKKIFRYARLFIGQLPGRLERMVTFERPTRKVIEGYWRKNAPYDFDRGFPSNIARDEYSSMSLEDLLALAQKQDVPEKNQLK